MRQRERSLRQGERRWRQREQVVEAEHELPGKSIQIAAPRRETTVLSLVMAYRLLREFRQASTRLDTPPFSPRHHPISGIARSAARLGIPLGAAGKGSTVGPTATPLVSALAG